MIDMRAVRALRVTVTADHIARGTRADWTATALVLAALDVVGDGHEALEFDGTIMIGRRGTPVTDWTSYYLDAAGCAFALDDEAGRPVPGAFDMRQIP